MRGFAIALLAGLLAVTAPPASALCMENAEGGCTAGTSSFTIDIDEDDCPEETLLCIVDVDGNLSQAPNAAKWNLTIRNHASSDVTFELHAIGFSDDAEDNGTAERRGSVLLGTIDVPAGEEVRLDEVVVDQSVTKVRLQAMSEDEREGEFDQELLNFQILAVGGIVDEEPQGTLDDHAPDSDADSEADSGSKDSPGLPLALLVLGCMAAVIAVRRLK